MLAFEPFSGASGDMLTACLIDVGAEKRVVKENMEAVADAEVQILPVKKVGIRATQVRVVTREEHLPYAELIDIVRSSGLPSIVRTHAHAVFEILAHAEAAVHGVPLEELVFHELGARDAIADVVGACTAISLLPIDRIFTAPICLGGGYVETQHGQSPVPAPATAAILSHSDLIARGGPVEGELLTPTGAALLSFLTNTSCTFLPSLKVGRIGYGAGSRDYSHANVLRATLGQLNDRLLLEDVEVLETNVDDVTGEVLGNLIDELLERGALDVLIIPTTGKKNRAGHIIHVITRPSESQRLARRIIEETGSLGVRVMPAHHRITTLRRLEHVTLHIRGEAYVISVKVATDRDGHVLNISAEFDEARELAKRCNVPLKHIIRMAEQEAWDVHDATR
ncbi:MAG: nickel pincer cofactor biosynthesis protein LarC [Euryarchaeota archaeon]|nr:nickel pincer cofactor biosynthesis protein LarC [Euryarchaeota archaeon]